MRRFLANALPPARVGDRGGKAWVERHVRENLVVDPQYGVSAHNRIMVGATEPAEHSNDAVAIERKRRVVRIRFERRAGLHETLDCIAIAA